MGGEGGAEPSRLLDQGLRSALEDRRFWEEAYDWARSGEEWSEAWGGSDMQWYGTILPRLHRYLPAETILELGPGFGRWTRFLLGHCQRLIAVDLSEACIEACRERLPTVELHVNDGASLPMLADRSVGLAFSFDSLVEAEEEVLGSYLRELARVLEPGAHAFLHHSNAGWHELHLAWGATLPRWLHRGLSKLCLVDDDQGRALSMTAERFRELAEEAGLAVVSQERFPWGTRRAIDCLSVVVNGPGGPPLQLDSRLFMAEVGRLRELSELYGVKNPPKEPFSGSANPRPHEDAG